MSELALKMKMASAAALGKSLRKLLREKGSEEEICDTLRALAASKPTQELVQQMKLLEVVGKVCKAFSKATTTGKVAREIRSQWKAITTKDSSKKAKPKDEEAEFEYFPTTRAEGPSTSVKNVAEDVRNLSDARRAIFQLFYKFLKNTNTSNKEKAKTIALHLEGELDAHICSDSNMQGYIKKAKMLLYNMEHNQILRDQVISGDISPGEVVTLSAADLASQKQKVNREKLQAEQLEGRRSDWLEEHLPIIHKELGVNVSDEEAH